MKLRGEMVQNKNCVGSLKVSNNVEVAVHVVLDIDEHSRLVEVRAHCRGPPAAGDHPGPGRHGILDQVVHFVDRREVDQRPLGRAIGRAVTHDELLHRGGEPRDELVIWMCGKMQGGVLGRGRVQRRGQKATARSKQKKMKGEEEREGKNGRRVTENTEITANFPCSPPTCVGGGGGQCVRIY